MHQSMSLCTTVCPLRTCLSMSSVYHASICLLHMLPNVCMHHLLYTPYVCIELLNALYVHIQYHCHMLHMSVYNVCYTLNTSVSNVWYMLCISIYNMYAHTFDIPGRPICIQYLCYMFHMSVYIGYFMACMSVYNMSVYAYNTSVYNRST